jgi:aryl-alcohol dehydrogenase-like predicted oxidoreductase
MKVNELSSPKKYYKAIEKWLEGLGAGIPGLVVRSPTQQGFTDQVIVEAVVKLKNAGRIEYLGLSECSTEPLSAFVLDIQSPQMKLPKTSRAWCDSYCQLLSRAQNSRRVNT